MIFKAKKNICLFPVVWPTCTQNPLHGYFSFKFWKKMLPVWSRSWLLPPCTIWILILLCPNNQNGNSHWRSRHRCTAVNAKEKSIQQFICSVSLIMEYLNKVQLIIIIEIKKQKTKRNKQKHSIIHTCIFLPRQLETHIYFFGIMVVIFVFIKWT